MGSKRGSGYDAGPGSAVLEAPEESLARETGARGGRWQGRGPAPAGALQRGYGKDGYGKDGFGGDDSDEPGSGYGVGDEPEYVPRRGSMGLGFRGMPRSLAGRIVLGVVGLGVLGAVALAVAGVRSFLLRDPRFLVGSSENIQIAGAEHLTREQILSVFGADIERNIFRVPLEERRADLERLPWVEHAAVMRLLPDRIRVQITERTPVAFVRQGTQIGLVDGGGVLLDMPPDAAGDPHYSFPVLTGLSADQPLSQRVARMEVYQQFMRELGSAGAGVTDSLSEVDVSDPEDVKALIASGSSDLLVHFGSSDFLKRYHAFEQNLPEWKVQYPKLASADMRYEGQVVLEMGGGGGAVAEDASAKATATATTTATTTTKANAGVLRSAQDDGEKQATAKAPATAPAPAMTKAKATAKAIAPVKPSAANKPVVMASAANKPVVMGPAATRPVVKMPVVKATAAKKPGGAKLAVKKPVVKKPVVKQAAAKKGGVAGKKGAGLGMSPANEKVFAALAAAHKAAVAKAAKAGKGGGVTP
jgi:cell division protein FtsQ